MITVTNTFTDTAGARVHTLQTTVVGLTAEDLNPAIKTAVQKTMNSTWTSSESAKRSITRRSARGIVNR